MLRPAGAVRICRTVVLVLLVPIAASAQVASHGFDTAFLVPPVGQACDGVPDCETQRSETVTLAPGERREIAASCDARRPFFWNWDLEAHHHLSVVTRHTNFAGLTVVATNRADAPGKLTLLLGCSKRSWERSGLMTGASFLPRPPEGGAVREEGTAPPEPAALPAAGSSDLCSGIPECQVQPQTPVKLKPLQTKGWAFYCTGDYPYYVKFEKQGSCCSATENPFVEDRPSKCDVTLTNWKVYTHHVTIRLACSKIDPHGPPCNATSGPVGDPKCPINGKVRNTCSGGPVPVCIQTWEERCSDGRVFECTADQGVVGCIRCKS